MRLADLTGRRFGRLVVQERAPNRGTKTYWKCLCDCGNAKEVGARHLASDKIRSCGCFAAEIASLIATKHGETIGQQSPEYRTWVRIKVRCLNQNDHSFAQYGAVGVTICDEWRDDFSAFLRDMGRLPSPRHSIDRIDNTRGYEPGNCRWATDAQQSRNRRVVRLTAEDVEYIRRMASAGVPRKVFQQEFGVSKSVIADVVSFRTWRPEHV